MVGMVSVPELSAPGLKKLKRKGGRVDCYWVADEKLVKKGYSVKTVRLTGDASEPLDFAAMASVCRRCQAEMLQWASGIVPGSNRTARGTIAWLCDAFETDKDSPIHTLRRDTQLFYAGKLGIIKETVGTRRLDVVTGKDVRRWFREWGRYDEAIGTYVIIAAAMHSSKPLGASLDMGASCATEIRLSWPTFWRRWNSRCQPLGRSAQL